MKILVATPCYGGNVTDLYMRSVVSLVHDSYQRGVQVDVLAQYGESLITRARQDIFAQFYQGDWTHLVFIDGDIGFETDAFWRLIDSGHDVCAAPYPLKRLDWDAAATMPNAEEAMAASVTTVINYLPASKVRADGFVPVLDGGTGFMCITKDAAELMVEYYPELEYKPEGFDGTRWAVFDTFIDQGRYLSEDYAFCRRWQAIGGEVVVDTAGPKLQHRGLYTYGE